MEKKLFMSVKFHKTSPPYDFIYSLDRETIMDQIVDEDWENVKSNELEYEEWMAAARSEKQLELVKLTEALESVEDELSPIEEAWRSLRREGPMGSRARHRVTHNWGSQYRTRYNELIVMRNTLVNTYKKLDIEIADMRLVPTTK